MAIEKFIWSEKYAPQTLEECILTDSTREFLTSIVTAKRLPNLLFYGPPGMGKTTLALVLAKELDLMVLFINGSKDRGIDVLRNSIESFASTKALNNKKKVVIFDEAEGLNVSSTQQALKGFIDENQSSCAFIFTCNHPQQLIEPIRSRCTEISFALDKDQRTYLMKQSAKRFVEILNKEGVSYNKEALKKVIVDHFPDIRKMLGELQRCAITRGNIDESLFAINSSSIDDVFSMMKGKLYSEVRAWCANCEMDSIYTLLYQKVFEYVAPEFIPPTVIILSKYQFQHTAVLDKELNLLACLSEIMFDVTFI